MSDHYTYMKMALETRDQSVHETHKVAAVVVGKGFEVARPNFYPAPLERTVGHYQKLGNASTTVHAEIAAILDASAATDGARLYITQRPCPNCAKAIIEAGIAEIYISVETRNTALGQKINPFFETASLPFLTHAGVQVFEVGEEVLALNEPRSCHFSGLEFEPLTGSFEDMIEDLDTPFAACVARDDKGGEYFLSAQAKTPRCLPHEKAGAIAATQSKYETALQPLNRLLMACARYGLRMDERSVYSSQTPTAREFVNLIGAGYLALRIGDESLCRDKWGLKALAQLREHGIVDLQSV